MLLYIGRLWVGHYHYFFRLLYFSFCVWIRSLRAFAVVLALGRIHRRITTLRTRHRVKTKHLGRGAARAGAFPQNSKSVAASRCASADKLLLAGVRTAGIPSHNIPYVPGMFGARVGRAGAPTGIVFVRLARPLRTGGDRQGFAVWASLGVYLSIFLVAIMK